MSPQDRTGLDCERLEGYLLPEMLRKASGLAQDFTQMLGKDRFLQRA